MTVKTIPPLVPSMPDFIEGPPPREIIRNLLALAETERRYLTPVEFGDALRALRKLSGQTLGGLADRLRCTAATLSAVELARDL